MIVWLVVEAYPSEKYIKNMIISWDDDIPNTLYGKKIKKKHVPNHQPGMGRAADHNFV